MLCQLCQKRRATVHATSYFPDHVEQRHLCRVCAGQISESELEQEKAAAELKRKEENTRARILIQQEILEPVRSGWQEHGMETRGRCFFGRRVLMGVHSSHPGVDPLEFLFGPSGKGKQHVRRELEIFRVHIVRWSADPHEYLRNLFEPFGSNRARLDEETLSISVEDEDRLLPDVQQSYEFCNAAAAALTAGYNERKIYHFRPVTLPLRLGELP